MLTLTYYMISHCFILLLEADKGKHKGKKI